MTEYRRYQGKSYMIISSDTNGIGYEYPMITENKITGLLPCQLSNENGKLQFWYEISGRQTLKDWIEIKKAGSELLRKLMLALAKTIERAGEYLLSEDRISMEPEQIFVDANAEEISFCYMPDQQTKLAEALKSFMEYYLSHMEHGDRENTRKCYEVYEKCQQGHTSPEELLKILFDEPDMPELIQEEEVKEPLPEKKSWKPAVLTEMTEASKSQKWQKHFWQRGIWKSKKMPILKKKIPQETYAFEPEDYQEEASTLTVFLGSETNEILGELKYEGDGAEANMKITESVFVIGSQREEADGIILADTVSRIHAKVTKEGEDYYLEDMNSTNGTYCNGKLLNYKEKVKLEKNDKVVFAKERYRFV